MRWRIWMMLFITVLCIAGCGKELKPTEDLLADLSSGGDGDRLKAVRLLQSRQGDADKVVPALIKSLTDTEVDVRLSAAIGLGNFGANGKSAIPALEELQEHDKDARVRNAARTAISRIKG